MSPAKQMHIVIDGESLTPEMVHSVAYGRADVQVSQTALKKVQHAHTFLLKEIGKNVVYGITTGFGPMASHIIGKSQLIDLQYNLIRSHAVGAGEPIRDEFVIAAMVDRLNTLSKGQSGVSPELIKHMETFINRRIVPVVPEHGAVGASGDLVQLAHIALSYIGEGEVRYRGVRMSTADVLRNLKIKPYVLQPKEGLALINGTSVMTGIAALIVVEAQEFINFVIRSGAIALELINGFDDSFSEVLNRARPHAGQNEVAKTLREIFKHSKLITDREQLQKRVTVIDNVYVTPEHIQDVYSFRCIPQIIGPVLDILKKVKAEVAVELNSVTDNPIIDLKTGVFLHGGNFHGDYIATAIDQLKIGLVKLTMLSERRVNFFLNRNVNQTFTPFLNMRQPGLTLALQGVQFVATSTTAQSQSLAFPHSLHSISTNADNQDIVSMGTDAALIAEKVLSNAYTVLAIELIVLAQAVDLLNVSDKLSPESYRLYKYARSEVLVIEEDRSFSKELNMLIASLRSSQSSQ